MKKVFSTSDRAELEVVRALLAEAGIESEVFNEAIPWGSGEIPFFSAMPELWILRGEDEQRALAIVEQYESGEAREALRKEPWKCPTCGEMIEGQFTECWHCAEIDPRQEPEARCERCGYLLRGLPERRCPECGERF
jgi:hypothetical protein